MSLKLRFILIYGIGNIVILALITLFVFSRMENEMIMQLKQQFSLNAEKKFYNMEHVLKDHINSFQDIAKIPIFHSMRYHQLTLNQTAMQDDT